MGARKRKDEEPVTEAVKAPPVPDAVDSDDEVSEEELSTEEKVDLLAEQIFDLNQNLAGMDWSMTQMMKAVIVLLGGVQDANNADLPAQMRANARNRVANMLRDMNAFVAQKEAEVEDDEDEDDDVG